ncbi:hypothetical protein CTEN210_10285 [Chaetoceros tenuissimus]|uniref:Ankyrin n=1 Tax=Chaetoceros tenuissimus TaxID=426638 RepID=A0AAD3H8G2_9STRA|nr:hypothetical protein CTEN210_10285 [Chaetoceros tenuissimus]
MISSKAVAVLALTSLGLFGFYLDPKGEIFQELTGIKLKADTSSSTTTTSNFRATNNVSQEPVASIDTEVSSPQEEAESEQQQQQEEEIIQTETFQLKQLRVAVGTSDIQTIQEILSNHPEWTQITDHNGYTIFHEAVSHGLVEAADALLTYGKVDIQQPIEILDKNDEVVSYMSPLDIARRSLKNEEHPMVTYLKEKGVKPLRPNWIDVKSALYAKDVKEVERILDVNPSLVLESDENGWTILHEAAVTVNSGQSVLSLVLALLEDEEHPVVQYLISKGAKKVDPAPKQDDGPARSLTDMLNKNDLGAIAQVFHQDPARLSQKDHNGWSILHEAVVRGKLDFIRYFVEVVKIDPKTNIGNENGDGPNSMFLAKTFLSENHPVTEYLRALGVEDARDISIPGLNNDDSTLVPKDVLNAALKNDIDTLKHILQARPHWSRRIDHNDYNVLHEVARVGNVDVAKILLEHGQVNVNARTNGGRGGTALYLAIQTHGEDHPMSQFLVSRGGEYIGPSEEL